MCEEKESKIDKIIKLLTEIKALLDNPQVETKPRPKAKFKTGDMVKFARNAPVGDILYHTVKSVEWSSGKYMVRFYDLHPTYDEKFLNLVRSAL